tara:strand:+ start:1892 stop:2566 length:675 start_codon:yes stop_codon:yes gene_type:complete
MEKNVKYGVGYKTFYLNSKKNSIHSGKYFYGGFSYQFGDKYLNKIQFQVSNSNREIFQDILYISAATAGNIYYDIAFKSISLKKTTNYIGLHLGNDFNLNFFPKIDEKNLFWLNQTFMGISFLNRYYLSEEVWIELNTHIPVISRIIYNKFDRLTSKIPNSKSVKSYSGSINKLFNAHTELGYNFSSYGLKWGVYYQLEINSMSETKTNKLNSYANSVSLRIIY